jgi:hypothetical protein
LLIFFPVKDDPTRIARSSKHFVDVFVDFRLNLSLECFQHKAQGNIDSDVLVSCLAIDYPAGILFEVDLPIFGQFAWPLPGSNCVLCGREYQTCWLTLEGVMAAY